MEEFEENDFNNIFARPPIFCNYCGDMLDFELIVNKNVICQKCFGETLIDNIASHQIITTDTYSKSKLWVNKLKNIEFDNRRLR